MKKIIALGIIALSLAGTASAQVKPEEQIKYRQACSKLRATRTSPS